MLEGDGSMPPTTASYSCVLNLCDEALACLLPREEAIFLLLESGLSRDSKMWLK